MPLLNLNYRHEPAWRLQTDLCNILLRPTEADTMTRAQNHERSEIKIERHAKHIRMNGVCHNNEPLRSPCRDLPIFVKLPRPRTEITTSPDDSRTLEPSLAHRLHRGLLPLYMLVKASATPEETKKSKASEWESCELSVDARRCAGGAVHLFC